MICLDSCFLIDLGRGDSAALGKLKDIENKAPTTTSINSSEIFRGIFMKGQIPKKELNFYQELFANIGVLNFDADASYIAAKAFSELKKEGKEIDMADCMIAGAMLSNSVDTIVTKNKHFERIKGIKTISY